MKKLRLSLLRRLLRRWSRSLLAALPESVRFAFYRRMADLKPVSSGRLELKIAHTQEELTACFGLLHDAYVSSGFMRPHPSGLRVTPYHALPTTTTLCAKVDGVVVGTISIIREGVFGFPMQSAFDISGVRAKDGRIAEISALAIHPRWRKTGGSILFPLMKFMYGYCTRYFDTRHLVIAVNPAHIEMYESLLFFRRLTANVVEHYDFVNGAPAVGATLDLHEAPELYKRAYEHKPGRRNLHRYFTETELPEITYPPRPWHTSNDPMLTPELLDHFFHEHTAFNDLDDRRQSLLHSIYREPEWARVLPKLAPAAAAGVNLRRETRYSMSCPATLVASDQPANAQRVTIVEISEHGFLARTSRALPDGTQWSLVAELAEGVFSRGQVKLVRQARSDSGQSYGFHIENPDDAWRRCVAWLDEAEQLPTSADIDADPAAPTALRTAAMSGSRELLSRRAHECV